MSKCVFQAALVVSVTVFYSIGDARLPAPSDAAKAQAADAAAKAAWTDKVALYKTCLAMDRVATAYRAGLKREGKDAPAPTPTPACTDPGAYTPITQTASKPIEASEAHSPTGTAISPPSTNVTAGAIEGKK